MSDRQNLVKSINLVSLLSLSSLWKLKFLGKSLKTWIFSSKLYIAGRLKKNNNNNNNDDDDDDDNYISMS